MKLQLVTLVALGFLAANVQSADKPTLTEQKDKISYSLGVNIGNTWRQRGVEADIDLVARGIRDALAGSETLLTEQEMRDVTTAYGNELRQKFEEKRKILAESNKQEAEEFLTQNKSKEGVMALPSGLQYKVLTDGAGPIPVATDRVSVHYRGTLLNGTEFDSSFKRNAPAEFQVTGVIKGWQEALQLMKTGSKWQLFIPPVLAYGERGSGANIPPNSALIFEVELLSILPAAAQNIQINPAASAGQPVTSDIIKVPSAEELKKGAKIEIIKPEEVERLKQEAEKRKQ